MKMGSGYWVSARERLALPAFGEGVEVAKGTCGHMHAYRAKAESCAVRRRAGFVAYYRPGVSGARVYGIAAH